MFGVIPRPMWEKKMQPDARNRITLSMNSLLIHAGGKRILVETGAGDKMNAKLRDIYGLDGPFLDDGLRRYGVRPEDIDIVLDTHLHFDHCGGNTRVEKDKIVPAFPNARYIVQRGEFEHAMNPNERDRASYFPENYAPLEAAGMFSLLDGDREIAPGVEVIRLPGHTADMQGVKLTGGGKTAFLFADLGADDGASPDSVDYGLRSLPHDDAREQEAMDSRGCPGGLARAICARRARSRGVSSRAQRPMGNRAGDAGLAAEYSGSANGQTKEQSSNMTRKMTRKSKAAGKKEAIKTAIIGGSGLYQMAGLTDTREVRVKTPFGDPSDAIVVGTLEGQRVAFLSRHGRGHRFSPSEINYRANICALKMLGAERIISVSAVGSLREDLPPLDFMIPDQFFDRTRGRIATFFTGGIVAHIGFDKPTCAALSAHLAAACERAGVKVHRGGTYVCMEGPAFSTHGRIAHLPAAALRRDRNDRRHRGQTRARSGTLLRYRRFDHRLRLLAPATRRGHARRNSQEYGAQHRQRAARNPRSGALAGRRARVQMRRRARACDRHRPQDDSGGDEEAPRADHWEIHLVEQVGARLIALANACDSPKRRMPGAVC